MKKLNKLFLTLLAFIAVGLVSLSFVSCSDDDDEYENKYIYFYSDNTFKIREEGSTTQSDLKITVKLDSKTGTYTGIPTSDGTVTLTVKKEINQSTYLGKISEAVTAGKSSVTLTNSDVPLEDVTPRTITATVSGTTVTIDGNTYTRK